MKNIRILGTRDFVNPEADIYAESNHGMSVLSCMAMNQPNVMVGTAPEASYWLLRSEDEVFRAFGRAGLLGGSHRICR